MSPVYDAPITLSELGSSDHNIVLLRPTHGHSLEKGSTVRVTITCMSSDNRANFSTMLSTVRWEIMFRMRSCEEQFTFYQTVIDPLMCRCFPNKVVTPYSADKPWVTDGFRALVRNGSVHICVEILRKLDCFATKLTAQQCVCENNFIRLKSLHLVNRRHGNGGYI